jgi:hypothetical protein
VTAQPAASGARKEIIRTTPGEMLRVRAKSFLFALFLLAYSLLCFRYVWETWFGVAPFGLASPATAALLAGLLIAWRVSGASLGPPAPRLVSDG